MECQKNGRDLTINEPHYRDEIKDKKVVITVTSPKTDWREWVKTVGTLPFEYEFENKSDGYIISCDSSVVKNIQPNSRNSSRCLRRRHIA